MRKIDICYTTCHMETQTVTPMLPCFQYLKFCIKYLSSKSHTPIFYPYNYHDGSNVIILKYSGNKVEDYTVHNCLEFRQDTDHPIIINRIQSVSGIIHTFLGAAVCCKL